MSVRAIAIGLFLTLAFSVPARAAQRPIGAQPGIISLCDLSQQHGRLERARCLAQLIRTCAPNVHPETLAAIVDVESGAWPYSIHDNDSRRSYFPKTYDSAVQLAARLIGYGHSVDLGLGQINSGNLPGLGITVAQVFDQCVNLWAADRILSGAWGTAVRYFGSSVARAHPNAVVLYAISAYNSNSLFASGGYVRTVVDATQDLFVRDTVSFALGEAAATVTHHLVSSPPRRHAFGPTRPRIVVPFTYQPGKKPQ